MSVVLLEEYRNDILETYHYGSVCVVDQSGVKHSAGDYNAITYYRSCSKPIQAFPVLMYGLDKKYDLTPAEIAVMCASHNGDPEHVEVLESLLKKTGLDESIFLMHPTYPNRGASARALLRENKPSRKIYHNCSGKHIGLIIVARHLGIKEEDYWKKDIKTVDVIKELIAEMAEIPESSIKLGVDGCGVPVFAAPFHSIATSYLKLASPELIKDSAMRSAAEKITNAIHMHPTMICGKNEAVSMMSAANNIIAKDGAGGLCTFGLAKEKLGVVFRLRDGAFHRIPEVAASVLEKLNYGDKELIGSLRKQFPMQVTNDNNEIVGRMQAPFAL